MPFDVATLKLFDTTKEVDIETTLPDGSTQRTIIWVVVEGGEVFARSFRGHRGKWFQAAMDRPSEVALLIGRERWPVRAVLTDDDDSVARCSRGLEDKYPRNNSLASMLVPGVLGTTIRLDPL
ncbi:MAG: DUF2255 family protein [Chloroflexota bacterium]